MRLKTTSLMLAAGLLASGAPALANTVAAPAPHLVPGFYDPKTGTFKPYVNPGAGTLNPSATAVTRDGSIVVEFTIDVKSGIPANAPIYVEVDFGTSEVSSTTYNAYVSDDETATVEASRTSASTARATVTIPYSWPHLLTPTKDQIAITYVISAGTLNATTGRTSSQLIGVLNGVPANGATTVEKVSATI
jgi:hypothetical protein